MKIKKNNIQIIAALFTACITFVLLPGVRLPGDELRGDRSLSGGTAGSLAGKLKLLWSFKTGDEIKSSPVIGSGRVFIGSMGKRKVYALSLAHGERSGPTRLIIL